MRINSCAITIILASLAVTAHAEPKVSMYDIQDVGRAPNDPNAVEVVDSTQQIFYPVFQIGTMILESKEEENALDLIQIAKSRTAEIGGDLAFVSKIESVRSTSSGGGLGFAIPIPGLASLFVNGGTSTQLLEKPKLTIHIFAKNRAAMGFIPSAKYAASNQYVIDRFSSTSKGPDYGFLEGDEVLEINQIAFADKRTKRLLFNAEPGSKVQVYIRRGNQYLTKELELVEVK